MHFLSKKNIFTDPNCKVPWGFQSSTKIHWYTFKFSKLVLAPSEVARTAPSSAGTKESFFAKIEASISFKPCVRWISSRDSAKNGWNLSEWGVYLWFILDLSMVYHFIHALSMVYPAVIPPIQKDTFSLMPLPSICPGVRHDKLRQAVHIYRNMPEQHHIWCLLTFLSQ